MEKSGRISITLQELRDVVGGILPERLKNDLMFQSLEDLNKVLEAGQYEVIDNPTQ